jgi:hypothetical protein
MSPPSILNPPLTGPTARAAAAIQAHMDDRSARTTSIRCSNTPDRGGRVKYPTAVRSLALNASPSLMVFSRKRGGLA